MMMRPNDLKARRTPTRLRRRGVASVLSMMFLVIFGSLAAAMAVVAAAVLAVATQLDVAVVPTPLFAALRPPSGSGRLLPHLHHLRLSHHRKTQQQLPHGQVLQPHPIDTLPSVTRRRFPRTLTMTTALSSTTATTLTARVI